MAALRALMLLATLLVVATRAVDGGVDDFVRPLRFGDYVPLATAASTASRGSLTAFTPAITSIGESMSTQEIERFTWDTETPTRTDASFGNTFRVVSAHSRPFGATVRAGDTVRFEARPDVYLSTGDDSGDVASSAPTPRRRLSLREKFRATTGELPRWSTEFVVVDNDDGFGFLPFGGEQAAFLAGFENAADSRRWTLQVNSRMLTDMLVSTASSGRDSRAERRLSFSPDGLYWDTASGAPMSRGFTSTAAYFDSLFFDDASSDLSNAPRCIATLGSGAQAPKLSALAYHRDGYVLLADEGRARIASLDHRHSAPPASSVATTFTRTANVDGGNGRGPFALDIAELTYGVDAADAGELAGRVHETAARCVSSGALTCSVAVDAAAPRGAPLTVSLSGGDTVTFPLPSAYTVTPYTVLRVKFAASSFAAFDASLFDYFLIGLVRDGDVAPAANMANFLDVSTALPTVNADGIADGSETYELAFASRPDSDVARGATPVRLAFAVDVSATTAAYAIDILSVELFDEGFSFAQPRVKPWNVFGEHLFLSDYDEGLSTSPPIATADLTRPRFVGLEPSIVQSSDSAPRVWTSAPVSRNYEAFGASTVVEFTLVSPAALAVNSTIGIGFDYMHETHSTSSLADGRVIVLRSTASPELDASVVPMVTDASIVASEETSDAVPRWRTTYRLDVSAFPALAAAIETERRAGLPSHLILMCELDAGEQCEWESMRFFDKSQPRDATQEVTGPLRQRSELLTSPRALAFDAQGRTIVADSGVGKSVARVVRAEIGSHPHEEVTVLWESTTMEVIDLQVTIAGTVLALARTRAGVAHEYASRSVALYALTASDVAVELEVVRDAGVPFAGMALSADESHLLLTRPGAASSGTVVVDAYSVAAVLADPSNAGGVVAAASATITLSSRRGRAGVTHDRYPVLVASDDTVFVGLGVSGLAAIGFDASMPAFDAQVGPDAVIEFTRPVRALSFGGIAYASGATTVETTTKKKRDIDPRGELALLLVATDVEIYSFPLQSAMARGSSHGPTFAPAPRGMISSVDVSRACSDGITWSLDRAESLGWVGLYAAPPVARSVANIVNNDPSVNEYTLVDWHGWEPAAFPPRRNWFCVPESDVPNQRYRLRLFSTDTPHKMSMLHETDDFLLPAGCAELSGRCGQVGAGNEVRRPAATAMAAAAAPGDEERFFWWLEIATAHAADAGTSGPVTVSLALAGDGNRAGCTARTATAGLGDGGVQRVELGEFAGNAQPLYAQITNAVGDVDDWCVRSVRALRRRYVPAVPVLAVEQMYELTPAGYCARAENAACVDGESVATLDDGGRCVLLAGALSTLVVGPFDAQRVLNDVNGNSRAWHGNASAPECVDDAPNGEFTCALTCSALGANVGTGASFARVFADATCTPTMCAGSDVHHDNTRIIIDAADFALADAYAVPSVRGVGACAQAGDDTVRSVLFQGVDGQFSGGDVSGAIDDWSTRTIQLTGWFAPAAYKSGKLQALFDLDLQLPSHTASRATVAFESTTAPTLSLRVATNSLTLVDESLTVSTQLDASGVAAPVDLDNAALDHPAGVWLFVALRIERNASDSGLTFSLDYYVAGDAPNAAPRGLAAPPTIALDSPMSTGTVHAYRFGALASLSGGATDASSTYTAYAGHLSTATLATMALSSDESLNAQRTCDQALLQRTATAVSADAGAALLARLNTAAVEAGGSVPLWHRADTHAYGDTCDAMTGGMSVTSFMPADGHTALRVDDDATINEGDVRCWRSMTAGAASNAVLERVDTAAATHFSRNWLNGRDATLLSSPLARVGSAAPFVDDEVCVFLVFELGTTAGLGAMFELSSASPTPRALAILEDGTFELPDSSMLAGGAFPSGPTQATFCWSVDRFAEVRVNGQSASTSTSVTTPTSLGDSEPTLGCKRAAGATTCASNTAAADTVVAEVIVVKARLDADERSSIECYLAETYGLEQASAAACASTSRPFVYRSSDFHDTASGVLEDETLNRALHFVHPKLQLNLQADAFVTGSGRSQFYRDIGAWAASPLTRVPGPPMCNRTDNNLPSSVDGGAYFCNDCVDRGERACDTTTAADSPGEYNQAFALPDDMLSETSFTLIAVVKVISAGPVVGGDIDNSGADAELVIGGQDGGTRQSLHVGGTTISSSFFCAINSTVMHTYVYNTQTPSTASTHRYFVHDPAQPLSANLLAELGSNSPSAPVAWESLHVGQESLVSMASGQAQVLGVYGSDRAFSDGELAHAWNVLERRYNLSCD